jgi:predicted neutral ceramidase superfamily lipid hydrolase
MDSMKITDIVCMLLSHDGPPPDVTLDMFMRLYDRAHSRYMAAVAMFAVMTMCVLGVLIASAVKWEDTKVSLLAVIALVFLMVATTVLSRRLSQLSRDYLDIIRVYNLMGRYMKSGRYLYAERPR